MTLRETLADTRDLLLFRLPDERLARFGAPHLLLGLLLTWLAGVGRYWDAPRATLAQQLGLGSPAVALGLAALLWLLYQPLRPAGLQFRALLAFVLLTAPPALLYAIPVERWSTVETAAQLNLWLLAVVALWRVALLARYLPALAGFHGSTRAVALLLPLAVVVVTLTALNLEHATVDLMGGLRETTAADEAYGAMIGLTVLSFLAAPVLGLAYLWLVVVRSSAAGGVGLSRPA